MLLELHVQAHQTDASAYPFRRLSACFPTVIACDNNACDECLAHDTCGNGTTGCYPLLAGHKIHVRHYFHFYVEGVPPPKPPCFLEGAEGLLRLPAQGARPP